MNRNLLIVSLFAAGLFPGCSSEPGDSDIKKKILLEYVCMETAKVNDLRINGTKTIEAISGAP